MGETVGIRELRQNLSKYLRRIEAGERLIVTDRNRPVAELGPLRETLSARDRLIAEGRLIPALRPGGFADFEPLPMDPDDPYSLSRALDEIRADRDL